MTHFVSVGTGAARVQDLSMNPQKLAGQCAKLKCCLNFETDVYSEAQHKMPPKDAVLQTMDTDYYFFKQDVLAGIVTYSTDKKIPANLVTISAERAIEVIALNKQGVKVEALDNTKSEEKPQATEYVNLVGQDSLTRFDKSKKKKKKSKPSGDHRQEGEKRPDHQERKHKQRRRPGGGNKHTEPKEG